MIKKEYSGRSNINLYNCNNMEFMKSKPDNYYTLAIVDPPYGIGEDGAKNHSRGGAAHPTLYTPKNWDNSAPNKEYFIELLRVSKNVIIWGANHFIENIPNQNSASWVVWNKQNGDNDFADCELAWTNHKTAVRMFEFRWAGMLQGDMKNKETRIHPTQKPVALYKWLLDKYAKCLECGGSGEVASNTIDCDVQTCKVCKGKFKILDTHGGSMSIALACWDYGFDLDLCELDTEYFNKGVEKFENHIKQQKLF